MGQHRASKVSSIKWRGILGEATGRKIGGGVACTRGYMNNYIRECSCRGSFRPVLSLENKMGMPWKLASTGLLH